MPRAVLDSSVLVSAFLSPKGTPATLIARARAGAFVVCSSQHILAETAAALARPRTRGRQDYTAEDIRAYCMTLAQIGDMATDLPEITGAVPLDPKDDVIVATAVAAKADCLVTGDRKHLLPLGSYEGIRIVTPVAFLAELGRPAAPSTSPT